MYLNRRGEHTRLTMLFHALRAKLQPHTGATEPDTRGSQHAHGG